MTALHILTGGAIGAAVAAVSYGIVSPTSSLFCPVITRGPGGCGDRVALTFDDGPLPGVTDAILDHLERGGARATFFVISRNAERWPDLARRIVDEGHVIGNHTAAHSYRTCAGFARGWEAEIRRADEVIASLTGLRPAFFRPPMGFKTWHLREAVRRTGHSVISWSRRALDGVPTTAPRILARLRDAAPGEILALHDGVAPLSRRNPRATVDAVPLLLESMARRGTACVGLDTLLGMPAYSECAA